MTDTPNARPRRRIVHEVVHLDALGHVYGRPPLGRYIRQLWERRHFIAADARGRVVGSSRGMILGLGWLILRPLLDGAAYYVVFGLVLRTSRGIENFVGYLLIGIFLFQYTVRCLNVGSQSIIGSRNLVRGFTFPRATLPLAGVVRESLTMVPVLAVLLILILIIPPHEQITWRWALFPVVLALQLAFSVGLAVGAARVTAHIPDTTHLISVLSRFWLYGSAVFFSYDRFLAGYPQVVAVLELNPMFIVLDISRDLLLYAVTPDLGSWLVLAAWSMVSLVGGLWFFWRAEETYGSV